MHPPEVMDQKYIDKLINVFKTQKKVSIEVAHLILHRSRAQLEKLPNLVEIQVPTGKELTVVGDTHGQFFDVLKIFEDNKQPSEDNPYVFNGDFIDRGSFGCEVFLTMACLKLVYPNTVHLLRGNHESKQCTSQYGFKTECEDKYDFDTYLHFIHVFNALPLCALINKKILILHGGIPGEGNFSLEECQHLPRFVEPGEDKADDYTDDFDQEYVRCGGGTAIWDGPKDAAADAGGKEGIKKKMAASQKELTRLQKASQRGGFISFLKGAQCQKAVIQMLWADPSEDDGIQFLRRTIGYSFGPDITKRFLAHNGLTKIIRSHQVQQEGYLVQQEGKIVTLFSCPNYSGGRNKGAYMKIQGWDYLTQDDPTSFGSPPPPPPSSSSSSEGDDPEAVRPLLLPRALSASAAETVGHQPSPTPAAGAEGGDRPLKTSVSESVLPVLEPMGITFHTYEGVTPPPAKKYK